MQVKAFDRPLSLRELLGHIPPQRLRRVLEEMLQSAFRLVSEEGEVLSQAGEAPFEPVCLDLELEMERVGRLEVEPARADRLPAAGMALELLLQEARRYAMAADLHLEAVHEDYRELQRKHAALAESEARCRELNASLERRIVAAVAAAETARRQLYQTEKMAAIGQLAAGMAHEINNPFGFIRSNLNTARGYVRQLQQLSGFVHGDALAQLAAHWKRQDLDFLLADFDALLEESLSGADRVARIVADLKGFTEVDRTGEQMMDLNECVRATCGVAGHFLNGRAEVVLRLSPLPAVRCMPGQINQILHHLLHNAALSMTSGRIEIASSCADGWVAIEVRDDGCGIDPAALPRVFEPFFTTRPVNEGRGLGLSVSQDIARAHGGRIDAASRPGEGSVFTLRLPAAVRAAQG